MKRNPGSSIEILPQMTVTLPCESSGVVRWSRDEREYPSQVWDTRVATNISIPTLEIFNPEKEAATGAAAIIAPGGGMFAQSIEKEGREVARWLVQRGIAAVVLKYRLVPSGEDGTAELVELLNENSDELYRKVAKVMPLAVEDGLNAVSYVRGNANKLGVIPSRIGVMGFSAGGAVAMGVGYNYSNENRPDFLVPIYAWVPAMPVQTPRKDAPPILIICASDDPLELAPGSIEIYNSWLSQGLSAGLHMYSKGGHGFGMSRNGLPADNWIERFYDWFSAEGFLAPN